MNKGLNYIVNYFMSEHEELNVLYKHAIAKKNSLEHEIHGIDSKLKELKDSIDFAYEALSPNSDHSCFLEKEIQQLESNKKQIVFEYEEIIIEVEKYTLKLDKIKESLIILDKLNLEEKKIESSNLYYNRFFKEQEIERQRIASDLHDSVIQMLSGLIHKIEFCSKVIDSDPVRIKLEMQIITKIIRDSINGIRDIIYDLRPMTFDDFGFVETLKRAIDKISKDSDIYFEFNVSGEAYELNQLTSITLYRVVLESCINSIKYSNAKNVNILLTYNKDSVNLSIKDNGQGFNSEEYKTKTHNNERKGFGLIIMRERVLLLSGEFSVESEINKGTEIYVRIPTKERQGE